MHARLQPDSAIRLWMRRAGLCCGLLALSCFALTCLAPLGRTQSKVEFTPYDVEAAYLYNFGKFVQWPSGPAANSPQFSICIVGQDNFGKKLDNIVADETIQGHKIVATRLSSVEEAGQCQIMFIGLSEDARLAKDLDALAGKPILTVSNIPTFVERGGMIQFRIENNRVRFDVNLPAAKQAGLELSSQLLKVAVHVTTNPPKEEKK